MNQHPLRILLVEDDPEDALIIQMVLKKARVPNELFVVGDGQEALDFLYHRGRYSGNNGVPRPELILMGINLPKVNGIEVLRRLKSDQDLKKVPVTIFTRSDRDEDVNQSYQLGVNCYIRKPSGFDSFVRTIQSLYRYWTTLAKLPS
jgi:CheY-like chemotaxis protein